MYIVDKNTLDSQINNLMNGEMENDQLLMAKYHFEQPVTCPACPSELPKKGTSDSKIPKRAA